METIDQYLKRLEDEKLWLKQQEEYRNHLANKYGMKPIAKFKDEAVVFGLGRMK